jgi:hypothetical protein
MSELKKTIKINPELFHMKTDKTRKNSGEKKQKVYQPLVINESSLKKQFLNRIKEHKNKEKMSESRTSLEDSFNNEFMDSIDYLSSLSQKHKANGDKIRHEQKRQPQQVQQLQPPVRHNYTIKNQNQFSIPHVELDLPEELREPFVPYTSQPMKLNYSSDNSVPYGCLKNGSKPTYRTWQQQMTRRNVESYQPQTIQQPQSQSQTTIQQAQINPIDKLPVYKEMSEREKKLELLKERMKQQQEMLIQERMKREHLEQQLKNREIMENQMKDKLLAPREKEKETKTDIEIKVNESVLLSGGSQPQPKQFIKKTIRRKYTLGKSTVYKKVGILIKDKNTRKKVIQAQKDMKKKPLNEVKQYLKEHGLLKVGSNAPNDVIRKTFESAMLTGEVVNLNKDVLIHNLLNEPQSNE